MSSDPIPLLGGESVYCISQSQLEEAFHLAEENPQTAPRIQREIERLEGERRKCRRSRRRV